VFAFNSVKHSALMLSAKQQEMQPT